MTNNYTMFNKIILTETGYSDGKKLHEINCGELDNDMINFQYCKARDKLDFPYELIGKPNQQIKPCFDLDPKFKSGSDIDIPKTINEGLSHIRKIYPNKDIKIYSRIRDLGDFTKLSYHAIVSGVRTDIYTIKSKLEKLNYKNNEPFDHTIYSKNRGLYPVFSNKKKDSEGTIEMFKPIDENGNDLEWNINLKEYCASYIEESFEMDILPLKGPVSIDNEYKIDVVQCNENDPYSNLDLNEIIKHLDPKRADDRTSWLDGIFCVMNCADSKQIKKKGQREIAHLFSSICAGKYDEDQVEEWLDINFMKKREHGYKWKFLLDWLKEDNPVYYNEYISIKQVLTYQQMKIKFELECVVINNPVCFYRTPDIPRIITDNTSSSDFNQQLSKTQLITLKENVQCSKKEFDKNGKPITTTCSFISNWLVDPKRLTYEGIRFAPSGMCEVESKYYKNLFNGFKADRIKINDVVDYTKIKPILDHMKLVFCNNNDEHYQYFLKWIAQTICHPEKRPQVGLVFYSKDHGTGRNSFTNYLGTHIFGIDLYVTTRGTERIFTKFNSILRNCMLLVIEEASGEIKKFMEDFKNLITEPYFTIEKKNIDPTPAKNYVNPILLTNNINILDIDDKDRRFAIFESSNCMKGNKVYFENLYKCLDDTQNAALFIKYLREEVELNWTTMDFQENRPLTEVYRKQLAMNSKNYIKYISHIVNDGGIEIDSKFIDYKKYKGITSCCIKEKTIYEDYTRVCLAYKYTAYSFDAFFQNIYSKESGISRVERDRSKCCLINRDLVIKWVSIYRNETDVPIVHYNTEDEEE